MIVVAASTAGIAGRAVASSGSDDGPSSKPQDYKDHVIVFKIGENEGTANYSLSVPDSAPDLKGVEKGSQGKGGDSVQKVGRPHGNQWSVIFRRRPVESSLGR